MFLSFSKISLVTGFEEEEFLSSSSLKPSNVSILPKIRDKIMNTIKIIGRAISKFEKIKSPNMVSLYAVSYTHLTLPTTPYV